MSAEVGSTSETDADTSAKAWLALALVTLFVGGALSLVLIMSRVPGMTRFFDAPLLAKRSLVIHVNLVLTCSFSAFIAALFKMIPGGHHHRFPVILSSLGVVILCSSGLVPGTQPILANYVPVLDQPVFHAGLSLFAIGVVLALADRQRLLGTFPRPARQTGGWLSDAGILGMRVTVWLAAIGTLLFLSALITIPRTMAPADYYEALFWGIGHTFQFVFLAAMLVVWAHLVRDITGSCPLEGRRIARAVFALLVIPALPALWLLGKPPSHELYFILPTELMRLGTWAAPAVVLALSVRALFRTRLFEYSASLSAFLASVVLLGLGIALGVWINRASTLVPAHYHATVGAITVAFMGITYLLLEEFGMPLPTERLRRWSRWQPLIFGLGQLGFVSGFAYAGLYGLGRKVYGHEQALFGVEQKFGLAVMGTGGLFALIGGLLFMFLVWSCVKDHFTSFRSWKSLTIMVLLGTLPMTGCATTWRAGLPAQRSSNTTMGPAGNEPRCIRLSSGAEGPYRVPLSGPEEAPELAARLEELPSDVRRTVLAAGLEPALARLLRDRAEGGGEIELLARRQAIALHLQSLKVQLDATTFEADCSGDQVEALRATIDGDYRLRELHWTALSLIVGAVAAATAGGWQLAESDSRGAAIIGLTGGLASAGLGLAAFIHPERQILLSHERNLLTPIVTGEDPEHIYPSFVFRLLTLPVRDGLTPRDVLRSRLDGLLEAAVAPRERTRAEALLFGTGGTYDPRMLELRERMLDELETAIAAFARDIEVLQRFLGRTLDPGCLHSEADSHCPAGS